MSTPKANDFEGFLSEKAKHRHTILIGIMAAVYVVFSMVVGQFGSSFSFQFSANMTGLTQMYGRRAVYWNEELWVPSVEMQRLNQFNWLTYRDWGPTEFSPTEIPMDLAWPIVHKDSVWWIAKDGIAQQTDSMPVVSHPGKLFEFISPPFIYQGKVSVLNHDQASATVWQLNDGEWEESISLPFELTIGMNFSSVHTTPNRRANRQGENFKTDIQFVEVGDKLGVFRKSRYQIYFHPDATKVTSEQPFKDSTGLGGWKKVAKGKGWSAATIDGIPTLACISDQKNKVIVFQYIDSEWVEHARFDTMSLSGLSIQPATEPGKMNVIAQPHAPIMQVYEVDDSGAKVVTGSVPLDIASIMKQLLLVIALTTGAMVLFVVATAIANGIHRHDQYVGEAGRAKAGMLMRRALARIIDSLISSGPSMVVGYLVLQRISLPDLFTDFLGTLKSLMDLWIALGVTTAWSLLYFAICCCTEAYAGSTIGKFCTGLQVVRTDFERCGLIRAIGRNFLLMLDQMFGSAIGIGAMSVSKHWQRVGDMICGTIVIRRGSIQEFSSEPSDVVFDE